MAAAAPLGLRIPAIGVESTVMALGLQRDGTMAVPPAAFPAGWYTGGPTPGELGPAVVVGHVDWNGQPGVFQQLGSLQPQDEVEIARGDGTTVVFRVTSVVQYAKGAFPSDLVYGDIDHAGLRLITCGGAYDRRMRSYGDNIVVYAVMVGSAA